jgi:ubiquinone/menaquinone biosynthesis C-methylase UbiE
MAASDRRLQPPADVISYYEQFPEEHRLGMGPSQLEFERTKEILARLFTRPQRVVDVGGAAGAYSLWLAERGHEVHLVDAMPRLVQEARRRNAEAARPIASLSVADARALPQRDAWADAVLVMGPLYHLPDAGDRMAALREAHRVLVPGGRLVVAAISRYASTLDGLARRLSIEPAFARIRDRDLVDGQHHNDTGRLDYFTTAYFHRPEDLRAELEQAGFGGVEVLGVEGPAWILSDFDERWADAALRTDMLDIARRLEAEPSIVGLSAHLLSLALKGSTS